MRGRQVLHLLILLLDLCVRRVDGVLEIQHRLHVDLAVAGTQVRAHHRGQCIGNFRQRLRSEVIHHFRHALHGANVITIHRHHGRQLPQAAMRDGTSGAGVLLHRFDDLLQCSRVHRILDIFDLFHRFHGGHLVVFNLQCLLVELVAGHTKCRTQGNEQYENAEQHPRPFFTLIGPCRGVICVVFHDRQLRFVRLQFLVRFRHPIREPSVRPIAV